MGRVVSRRPCIRAHRVSPRSGPSQGGCCCIVPSKAPPGGRVLGICGPCAPEPLGWDLARVPVPPPKANLLSCSGQGPFLHLQPPPHPVTVTGTEHQLLLQSCSPQPRQTPGLGHRGTPGPLPRLSHGHPAGPVGKDGCPCDGAPRTVSPPSAFLPARPFWGGRVLRPCSTEGDHGCLSHCPQRGRSLDPCSSGSLAPSRSMHST